jgi:hypothetical protein
MLRVRKFFITLPRTTVVVTGINFLSNCHEDTLFPVRMQCEVQGPAAGKTKNR